MARNIWRNPGETGLDANGKDKATNSIDDDNNGYVDDVYGADVLAGTGDPMDQGYLQPPFPVTYHGTLCAGIIGAEGNNGIGVTGINWSIQMMGVRIFGGDVRDLQGHPDYPFYENIVAGLNYVLKMKRRGVNIRVASCSFITPIPGDALYEAVQALREEGVLCVFAAGNETFNLDLNSGFPGCFNLPNSLVVANANQVGALNAGSSFGKGTVDLAAPGTDILTTTKGGYASVTGTSFACPLVAGACALILSAHPELEVEDLKAALFGSVDTSPALNGKVFTNGRLNVARALQVISDSKSPPIITTALPSGRPTPSNFPVQVTFNRPMDRASVENAFSITPAIDGTFQWTADSRSFLFEHTVHFDVATNYTVRIAGTAKDLTGQTLDGNFNRSFDTPALDDFTWTFRFAVANDDQGNATPLIGNSGTIKGDNRYSTWEPDEPQPAELGAQVRGNTVWYSFEPPGEPQWYTFDLTRGTTFDSILEVLVRDRWFNLGIRADNDNYGSAQASRLSFYGQSCILRVSGKNAFMSSGSGPFVLSWYPTPPPGFTGPQFSPSSGAPGTRVTLTGTNFTGATAVLFNDVPAAFTNLSGNNLDLHITATVPLNATLGPITIITPHGSVRSTQFFTVHLPPVSLAITKFENSYELSWNDTNDLYRLQFSMDLVNWDYYDRLRGVKGDRTFQAFTFQPGQAFFRLQSR